jgi:hypothetical protein
MAAVPRENRVKLRTPNPDWNDRSAPWGRDRRFSRSKRAKCAIARGSPPVFGMAKNLISAQCRLLWVESGHGHDR